MTTARVTSTLLGRTGYRLPMAAGLLVPAASLVGLALIPPAAGVAGAMWASRRLAGLTFVSGVGVGLASRGHRAHAREDGRYCGCGGDVPPDRRGGGDVHRRLVLSRSADQLAGFRTVWAGMGVLLVLATAFMRGVPDGRGGSSHAARERCQGWGEAELQKAQVTMWGFTASPR